EVNPVDGLDVRVMFRQPTDLDDGRCHRTPPNSTALRRSPGKSFRPANMMFRRTDLSPLITSAPSWNNAARARYICEGRGLAESASPPLGRNHARHPARHFHPRRSRRDPVDSVPEPGPPVPDAVDLHHPDPRRDENPPRGPPSGV